MSPRQRVVTGAGLLRALQRGGWQIARVSGSHHTLIHPERSQIVVLPIHGKRDLPPGTLRAILRQAGLTLDQLEDLL